MNDGNLYGDGAPLEGLLNNEGFPFSVDDGRGLFLGGDSNVVGYEPCCSVRCGNDENIDFGSVLRFLVFIMNGDVGSVGLALDHEKSIGLSFPRKAMVLIGECEGRILILL